MNSEETPSDSSEPEVELTGALLEALTDPIRFRLLTAMGDELFTVTEELGSSVRELAAHLEEPPRRVRHHLEKLVEQGLATVTREERRRGTIERYYRSERMLLVDINQSRTMPQEQSQKIALEVMRAITRDARSAVAENIFGAREGHSEIRIPGKVDLQGWREISAIHDRAMAEVQKVLAESQRRLAESDETPLPIISALLLFELPRER